MPHSHLILQLWIRRAPGGPMEPVDSLELETGRGIVGDHTHGSSRHVTIIFEDDWKRAADELKKDVDPVGRRANVLVSGGDGLRLLQSHVRLGETLLEVKSVTAPCPIMDEFEPGLMEALKPEGRGGVWCRIKEGGRIRQGDALRPEAATEEHGARSPGE